MILETRLSGTDMTIHEFINEKTCERYRDITEMPHEEGGFGRLYKAFDTQDDKKEVCIKVIKPNLSKELQMKLWHEEVKALKSYCYRSGIVHLVGEQYEFTRDDPYWFLVMEYVHGKRLGSSKYRIELNVEEDQAMRLIFQLCSVIYSIHQHGHYHQDIFPDNIKIQDEKLILLDLGGMREAERRSGTIIFGGEMYSPPEVSPTRLRMKRFRTLRKEKMGSFESADIFSIGAIFYELLMGISFFDSIDQSEQLKEYIYDYHSDPAAQKTPKKEYQLAYHTAKRNQQKLYTFLQQYRLPLELCQRFVSTLEVLHPQKRPSIEHLLQFLLPYMLQRMTEAYQRHDWQEALLWGQHVREHFDEIQEEVDHGMLNPDEAFPEKLMQHLLSSLSLSIRARLISGMCVFRQGHYEVAQQIFLKTKEVLERYEDVWGGQHWNTLFLKVVNNLAACYYKRQQKDEAIHLYKSLSTAQGYLGQIINHNSQVCTVSS